MPKPYSYELRKRVVDHVEKGHTHRSTASHFEVSIKFVNDMVKLKRETGDVLAHQNSGNKGKGKLSPYKETILTIISQKSDMTLNELSQELKQEKCLNVSAWGLNKFLKRCGFTHKKRQYLPKNNTDPI